MSPPKMSRPGPKGVLGDGHRRASRIPSDHDLVFTTSEYHLRGLPASVLNGEAEGESHKGFLLLFLRIGHAPDVTGTQALDGLRSIRTRGILEQQASCRQLKDASTLTQAL